MERELKKLRASVTGPSLGAKKTKPDPAAADMLDSVEKLEQYLRVGKGEITRLDYILTQFLLAIRPSPAQRQPTNLNDVVRDTIDLLRPEIENRGITIREKLSRSLPVALLDPAQIKQTLVNLIKNAIQAMTKDGVLTVQTSTASDGVVVSVADTGGGIPQEQINRIFEPFYTTKKKGSGLGLMIVQRIVREHNGRIDLESHVGRGTVFRLWLPLQERALKMIAAKHD